MVEFNSALKVMKKELRQEVKKIIDYIESSSKSFKSGLFDSAYEFRTEKELEKLSLRAKRGVYVFLMTNQVTLADKFNWTKCGSTLNDDNKVINKNEILYLGKSKSIKTRLKQHFSNTESSPNSLKLNTELRKNLLGNFVVYLFTMDDEYKSVPSKRNEAENIILGSVEDLLHEDLEPRVGSRRI